LSQPGVTKFQSEPISGDVEYMRSQKFGISGHYLANGTRWAHGYYGSLV